MSNTCVALPNFDLIRVSGEDAAKFLQGQITCNVHALTPSQWLPGAYCEVNGRVIADFRLFTNGEDYFMQCEEGVGATLKDALSKYVVFSKATIELVSNEYHRVGFWGTDAAQQWLDASPLSSNAKDLSQSLNVLGDCFVLNLAGNAQRFEIFVTKATIVSEEAPDQASLLRWLLADIRDGVLHIKPDMVAKYTPQVLNYDLAGAVDFKKGCYRGQEIVARMHYKGSAKKRLFRVQFEGEIAAIGSTLAVEGKELGEVLSIAQSDTGKSEALALMSTIALDIPVINISISTPDQTTRPDISVASISSAH